MISGQCPSRRLKGGSRRPLAVAGAAVALAGTLAACGAGPNAVTRDYYAPADGVNAIVGSMRALNALVVSPAPGGDATGFVTMGVGNNGTQPDTITRIVTDKGPVELRGRREIPPQSVLLVGGPRAETQARIPNYTGKPGETVSMDIEFERNPTIRLRTVSVSPTGYYKGFIVSPTAAPVTSVAASPAQTAPAAPAGTGGANPGADRLNPQDTAQD